MKEYHYESVSFHGPIMPGTEEHREIIAHCAAQGWTYVGYFPTVMTSHGAYDRVDLIFVREC